MNNVSPLRPVSSQEDTNSSYLMDRDPAELFQKYMEKAKIPEYQGLRQNVINTLINRIGNAPLSISEVAKDLNLSKRTLQRHLKEQGSSFSELRDQVRKHYAVDYLLRQNRRVDDIYTALDFSDRTSLTNAFRRWMGLAPSTFRKLFRDYV
ncbi:helix-turn-helix domain-containing protein [Agarilytica rhodophyticola]|uniref:helix-turn-helix domain-containing protein n=1 Tax=Agarilytica rhodophyticola TaxID=1737490 RepID=UPI000B343E76|nr:AraC family transcriptional regulator [Agarilytica rhodophyticola]